MDAATLKTQKAERSSESKRCRGSCFAYAICRIFEQRVFKNAFKLALPCAIVAAGVKYADLHGLNGHSDFLKKLGGTEVYSSCTFLIGMLILFRTSMAYSRYWDGLDAIYAMASDFFDVASQAIAFSKTSTVENEKVLGFQHLLVRLMSLLHVLMFAELEALGGIKGSEHALTYELIDAHSLDQQSWLYIQESDNKVHLVSQWIKGLLVDAIEDAVLDVPPPVSTRLFQEMNKGHCNFHKALKIADSPFPFPYTAASQICLVMHWCITPCVVGTWTDYSWYSAVLTFVQVFILWALDSIALELENPFGQDLNDIDVCSLHKEFNAKLVMLLELPSRHIPRLSKNAQLDNRSREGFRAVSSRRLSSDALSSSEDELSAHEHRRISERSNKSASSIRRDISARSISKSPRSISRDDSKPSLRDVLDLESGLSEFETSPSVAGECVFSSCGLPDAPTSGAVKDCSQTSSTKLHFEAALMC